MNNSDKIIDKNLFTAFDLAKVVAEKPLGSDIYIFIGDHFIKFKNAGDSIPGDKYNFFVSKSVSKIFVKNEDKDNFQKSLEIIRDQVLEATTQKLGGEEYRAVAEKAHEVYETVFKVFADEELNSKNVEALQGNVKVFLEEVSSKPIVTELLLNLSRQSGSIADHCVNTANISVFVAMLNGIGDKGELENIYQAAVFHDYAKAKIPLQVLENPNSPSYIMAINDHPTKGAEMIRKIAALPPILATLIEQHHEQFNGQGYPKKIKGEEIKPYAQFISMANVYDHELLANKKLSDVERHRKSIKVLEYDRGKNFNPKYIERTVDGLKLAFGNFKR